MTPEPNIYDVMESFWLRLFLALKDGIARSFECVCVLMRLLYKNCLILHRQTSCAAMGHIGRGPPRSLPKSTT
jgi:hypothetical protein